MALRIFVKACTCIGLWSGALIGGVLYPSSKGAKVVRINTCVGACLRDS